MNSFVVINSRKRAIIALVHSVIFLLLAFRSLIAPARLTSVFGLHGIALVQSGAVLAIYAIVTSILFYLVKISAPGRETIYFTFCSTSAGFGLLRTIVGDNTLYIGLHVRVIMLLCAVVTGVLIVRAHSITYRQLASETK